MKREFGSPILRARRARKIGLLGELRNPPKSPFVEFTLMK
jgi:hypothetical protein